MILESHLASRLANDLLTLVDSLGSDVLESPAPDSHVWRIRLGGQGYEVPTESILAGILGGPHLSVIAACFHGVEFWFHYAMHLGFGWLVCLEGGVAAIAIV